MYKQLKQLPNSDKQTKQHFIYAYKVVISAHNDVCQLIKRTAETCSVHEQEPLLMPGIIDVNNKMNALTDDINDYLKQEQLEVRQNRIVLIEASSQKSQLQSSSSQKSQLQASSSKESQLQTISSQESQPQEAFSELALLKNKLNSYSTIMMQIDIPFKLHSIEKLQLQNLSPLIDNLINYFICNTNLELQLKYLKTQDKQPKVFFGINIEINPNFSNLRKFVYKKFTVVRLTAFNTRASIYRYSCNNESYLTCHVGGLVKFKNNEINISTNFGSNFASKNMTFKKESFNFKIESNLELPFLPSIISSKSEFYCKLQFRFSYDFFRYQNSIVTSNLEVTSNLKTKSVAEIKPQLEMKAPDRINKSNLFVSEQQY